MKFLVSLFFLVSFTFATETNLASNIQKMYDNPKWLRLLYYKKSLFGYKSYMSNSEFFVAKNGSVSPKDEMEASINAILKNDDFKAKFPLRYKFLNETFHLKPIHEMKYKKYKKAYLIFPNIFTKAAASMFGHLYIALEDDSFIDSDVIHFGAITGNVGGVEYLARGLMGGFEANYINEKNYVKLKEYSVMESRDIYRYELNLSEEQLQDYALHVEELKHAKTKYYFMDENCAFFLAKSLEVVTNKDLTNELIVLPSDVVDHLLQYKLIKNSALKKSDVSIFEKQYQTLTKDEKQELISLIKNSDQQKLPSDKVLKCFLDISIYMIYNYPQYYDSIRKNRIKAFQQLQKNQQLYTKNSFLPSPTEKIKNQEIRISNLFNDSYSFYYKPMYYSKFNNFNNIYDVNVEALSLEYTHTQENNLALHLFDIENLIPYSDVLNNISWNTKYTIYDNLNYKKIAHLFELKVGYSENYFPNILTYQLLGFHAGSYNEITNQTDEIFIRPLAILGAKWNLNNQYILRVETGYRDNQLHTKGEVTSKINTNFGMEGKCETFKGTECRIGISYIF